MVRAALVLVFALVARSASAAQSEDFEQHRAEARAALLGDVTALAEWFHGKKLYVERQGAYELVLELDPEHARARKLLGYSRQKGGGWSPSSKPKTYRNYDKKALAEAPERWRKATAGFVELFVGLLESGELSAKERELAVAEVLRFEPDNERVHAILGDVQGEQGWVLPESLRAKERRQVLRGMVRSALEGAAPAAAVPLNERERKIPLSFKAVAAPGLRVVGTASQDELLLTVKAVLALQGMLQAVFESRHALPADTTVFMLSDPAHAEVFIANHARIPLAQREYFRELEGGGIQGTNDFAYWTGDMQRRIDGVVRLTLGYWLSGAYQVTVEHGWVYEGLGLYLTRSLVRTRLTWLAQPSRVLGAQADLDLRQKLLDPDTNWMDETLRMMQEGRQPPLGELFRKGGSELTTEDVLYSYTLATYLLEARPEILGPMLARLGRGYGRAQAFQEAIGMNLATFERHLERWLAERT